MKKMMMYEEMLIKRYKKGLYTFSEATQQFFWFY